MFDITLMFITTVLFDAQFVLSLDNGNLLKLAPESF